MIVRLVRMLPFVESPTTIMQQYLIDDEQVYFVDRPAPVTLLNKEMLIAVAIAMFATVGIGSSRAIAFAFAVVLAVAAWLGVKSIRYRYTRYIITSLRVMRMTGVFDRKYYWIPWQRVTDLGFQQTIIGRIFGFATIRIDSASENSGLKELSDLNDPWQFQQWVTQLVGRRQRYLNATLTTEQSAAAAERFDEAAWMDSSRRPGRPVVGRGRSVDCAAVDADAFNLVLLIMRLSIGLMIMAHGYNHIWGGGKITGTAGWFASMGMKPGIVHAWMASIVELGSGVLLIVGFLTPLAAAGVMGIVLVALMTAHRTNGFFIFKPGQGWEYVAFIAAMCLVMGTLGAGEWSIDDAADIFRGPDFTNFWITLVLGVGGAAGLLAGFWRPSAPTKP